MYHQHITIFESRASKMIRNFIDFRFVFLTVTKNRHADSRIGNEYALCSTQDIRTEVHKVRVSVDFTVVYISWKQWRDL